MCLKRKNLFFVSSLFILCLSCSKQVEMSLDNITFSKQNFIFCFKGKDSTQLSYIVKYADSELYKTQFIAENDSIYSFKRATFGMLSKKAYEISYEMATKDSFPIHYIVKNDSVLLCDTMIFYKSKPSFVTDSIYAYMRNTNYAGLRRTTYKNKIYDVKKFLVNRNLKVDSVAIENMAKYLFYLTENTVVYKNNKKVPVYKKLPKQLVNIETNMDADYFYLIAVKDQNSLDDFIKDQIANDFTKGQLSVLKGTKNLYLSPIKADDGNFLYLFLCGINKDWESKSIPVGGIIIDSFSPIISSELDYLWHLATGTGQVYRYYIEKFYDYFISFDYDGSIQTNVISLSYGDFEGNNYLGYSVPFILKIDFPFDLSTIIIQGERKDVGNMNIEKEKAGRDLLGIRYNAIIRFTHHFRRLNTGDNYIRIDFVDVCGNKSTATINIMTERVKSSGTEVNVFNEIYNQQ